MNTREFLAGMGASVWTLCSGSPVGAQTAEPSVIRWAELDVTPSKLDLFRGAALTLKDSVLQKEPGVAVYHAVSEALNPGRIHVLEMYDTSMVYEDHVRQPHFQEFRTATDSTVVGRRLYDVVPVKLGAKASLSVSPLVRIAELEIAPELLSDYIAAVSEEIETSIKLEPGVLTIYAVALKDNLSHLRFFEIYADETAYRQHIASPHFQKYGQTTAPMIRSRRLIEARPLFLGLRPR